METENIQTPADNGQQPASDGASNVQPETGAASNEDQSGQGQASDNNDSGSKSSKATATDKDSGSKSDKDKVRQLTPEEKRELAELSGKTVQYYPSSDDKELKKVLKENRVKFLTAKVLSVDTDAITAQVKVCVPGHPNVIRTLRWDCGADIQPVG